MKTYLAYTSQIGGFKDVSETVKTIEKVAASSVHYLKVNVAGLNEYLDAVDNAMARLSYFFRAKSHPLLQEKTAGKKALLVLSGDNALVGGLWHTIANLYIKEKSRYQSLTVIGGKGRSYLEEEGEIIEKFFPEASQPQEINNIIDYFFSSFTDGRLSRVDILYPKFISLAVQEPAFVPFLPFVFSSEKKIPGKADKLAPGLPIFESARPAIFGALLQKYIGSYLHRLILETKLSELSARTVSMEHAGAKTDELIKKLGSSFHKEQHRIITQRQVESFAAHKI